MNILRFKKTNKPPNVLKYKDCDKVLAISGVVTIAPIGKPKILIHNLA